MNYTITDLKGLIGKRVNLNIEEFYNNDPVSEILRMTLSGVGPVLKNGTITAVDFNVGLYENDKREINIRNTLNVGASFDKLENPGLASEKIYIFGLINSFEVFHS